MKKKTIIISGIATVLVIGSVVFCFAVKGDSTQQTDIAQTVTEAVSTPTIEIPEEEPEVVETETSEAAEGPEEEPEVFEEVPEVEESIVEVVETSEEVTEDAGVSTPEASTEETQPVETKLNANQISADEASQTLINQILADGGSIGIPEGVNISESGNVTSSSAGAGVTLE